VDAGTWGFIGVVVGGVLTLTGQMAAELIKGRIAKSDRVDRRAQLSREFQRETVTRLQEVMAAYRQELSRYDFRQTPSQEAEDRLAASRVACQMLLHRVSSSTARDAVRSWETSALYWFQGDERGSANDEAEAWVTAMRLTGEAVRAAE
jgi:hypothetical protein